MPEPEVAPTPAPVVHPDNAGFWSALSAHQLRLQRCTACTTLRYPVSPICPVCLREDHAWEQMSGRARLIAGITISRATGDPLWAPRTPYSVALVQLEEGPRLKGWIDGQMLAQLRPGDQVEVGFDDRAGFTLIRFVAPSAGPAAGV